MFPKPTNRRLGAAIRASTFLTYRGRFIYNPPNLAIREDETQVFSCFPLKKITY